MRIELFGGPCDGALLEVPDGTRIWLVTSPRLTPAQLISYNEILPGAAQLHIDEVPIAEYAYHACRRFAPGSGARLFLFGGQRVK